MKVLHLTASPNYGGVERVIFDLVYHQRPLGVESYVATFPENGNALDFIAELDKTDIPHKLIENDVPRLYRAYKEIVQLLQDEHIGILCAHGHKARMIGWRAARKVGIPIIGISHGWTGQDRKIKLFERIDKWVHRRLDAVIAVSQGQADKVIRYGTPKERVFVIHNAVNLDRFGHPDPAYRKKLETYFDTPPELLIGAAGRFSPEKGFDLMIDAVADLSQRQEPPSNFGVVLFGEGFLRAELEKRAREKNVSDIFKMPGFTNELDLFLPQFDIFAQSSRSEGFPCVNVEAMGSGVAVVATAVGGVPEQIEHGISGMLVAPNDSPAFADALYTVLIHPEVRKQMGEQAKRKAAEFTCGKQAQKYYDIYKLVTSKKLVQ